MFFSLICMTRIDTLTPYSSFKGDSKMQVKYEKMVKKNLIIAFMIVSVPMAALIAVNFKELKRGWNQKFVQGTVVQSSLVK